MQSVIQPSAAARFYRALVVLTAVLAALAMLGLWAGSRSIDFTALRGFGSAAGIWDGIATYLTIISGYVEAFRGCGIALPAFVGGFAKFGVDQVHYRRDFLRVPILPHSLDLYAGELRSLLMRGEVQNSLRLSLLPGLATAAALELKFTGSDKGIL